MAETRSLVNKGATSDTFAKHFASHFDNGNGKDGEKGKRKKGQVNIAQIRKLMKVSILWQGRPISNMKTFGKLNCTLCMSERLEILKARRLDKILNTKKMINSSNEIYGACRHKPKFHRFTCSQTSSTDEGLKSPERGAKKFSFSSPFNSPQESDSPQESFSPQESDYFSSPQCVPCDPLVEKNDGFLVVDL